jgi:uncharacterized membrane protein YgcG
MIFSRRSTTLFIVAVLSLQLVLISEHLRPVKASDKKKKLALKTILSYLFLLKTKKPKFGILPIPLPLPIPLKIEKPEAPIVVNKKHTPYPIVHKVPVPEAYPEYYPVEQAPSYVDGGYAEGGGYGGGYGGEGKGYGNGGGGGYGGGY